MHVQLKYKRKLAVFKDNQQSSFEQNMNHTVEIEGSGKWDKIDMSRLENEMTKLTILGYIVLYRYRYTNSINFCR